MLCTQIEREGGEKEQKEMGWAGIEPATLRLSDWVTSVVRSPNWAITPIDGKLYMIILYELDL